MAFITGGNTEQINALTEELAKKIDSAATAENALMLTGNADIIYSNPLELLIITQIAPASGRGIYAISFTSGSEATEFTAPESVIWRGDDCEGYIFIPEADTHYELIIEVRSNKTFGWTAGYPVEEVETE